MKRIVIISVLSLLTLGVFAQEEQEAFKVEASGIQEIVIADLPADIFIQGVAGKTVQLTGSYRDNLPERAKGLKPLGLFEDNTGQGVHVKEEGSTLYVRAATSEIRNETVRLEVPQNVTIRIDSNNPFAGDIQVEGFEGTLEATTLNQDIVLKGVTGPVVLHSISGDIDIDFTSLSQAGPMSISATSGDVDLSIPGTEKATVRYSTVTGELYTDLDLEIERKETPERAKGLEAVYYSSGFGKKRKATLNGGGVELKLSNVSGDFYLRKK